MMRVPIVGILVVVLLAGSSFAEQSVWTSQTIDGAKLWERTTGITTSVVLVRRVIIFPSVDPGDVIAYGAVFLNDDLHHVYQLTYLSMDNSGVSLATREKELWSLEPTDTFKELSRDFGLVQALSDTISNVLKSARETHLRLPTPPTSMRIGSFSFTIRFLRAEGTRLIVLGQP
jgi:CRP-like cAMP-binding protein